MNFTDSSDEDRTESAPVSPRRGQALLEGSLLPELLRPGSRTCSRIDGGSHLAVVGDGGGSIVRFDACQLMSRELLRDFECDPGEQLLPGLRVRSDANGDVVFYRLGHPGHVRLDGLPFAYARFEHATRHSRDEGSGSNCILAASFPSVLTEAEARRAHRLRQSPPGWEDGLVVASSLLRRVDRVLRHGATNVRHWRMGYRVVLDVTIAYLDDAKVADLVSDLTSIEFAPRWKLDSCAPGPVYREASVLFRVDGYNSIVDLRLTAR